MFLKFQLIVIEYLQRLFCAFHIVNNEKVIYLTFDDGPEPIVTEYILDLLDRYNAKATFFCCGNNVLKYNSQYVEIVNRGHSIGGHTMSHLKGNEVSTIKYIKEVLLFKRLFKTRLFRPPFMSLSILGCLILPLFVKIVLWDVDSEDWCKDKGNHYDVYEMVKLTRPGSIILFHFSKEHKDRTLLILPKFLKIMSKYGYVFKSIKL